MRGRKLRAALVERLALERRNQRHESADRILRSLRVSDMALPSGHDQVAVERASPANLDRSPQCLLISCVAQNAMIQFLVPLRRPFQQFRRAVDGNAFLVTSDQE